LSTTATIKLLLADDHDLIRRALRSVLAEQPDFEVVAEARDGVEAVRLAGEARPDVVVMDLRMPGLSGFDATRNMLAAAPDTKVVLISAHADARMAREAMAAGALGYVVKDAAFEELGRAVRDAHGGKVFLSRHVKE
jgi:DNA-binding NarL/FixJ family response regulator